VTTRHNKQPTAKSKKVAAPRRLSSATIDKASRLAGDLTAADVAHLVDELGAMIDTARKQVAVAANAALTLLHWHIGHRVSEYVLDRKRAEYGAQIVSTVSRQLAARYGRGFNEKSLRHMLRFAEVFPDLEIVSTASRELSWSHFMELIYLKDSLKRDFYVEVSRIERWSIRVLRERIQSMLFERTAISKKPEALIKKELSTLRESGELTPDLVMRDPYMLPFLGLADTYSEKDLESAILREIERFLLELGGGFAFVERQKRITLDGDDYYLDLLFFHRRMQRLVAIELKIGDFKPADSGQMELYLRWLDRHERQPSEQPPLGIILCAGKKRETVEILDLDARGIHVAEYLTELPPREVLEERLHHAIEAARNRLVLDADAVIDVPNARITKPKRKARKKR
jgi:predicted nuclease of restriction endonuclease-like (RecB) superfamily